MAFKTIKNLLLIAASLITGCQSPDYAITKPGETEIIYVEVEGETEIVEVEVPIYIEVEVEAPLDDTEVWVDSFTQPMSIEGIDILWVIDRSGSMNTHDAELLAGVEAMISALPTSDWRLVMISADPLKSVTSTEFPLVPGDDAEDARDMLATLTTAPREEGFNSVRQYITANSYSGTWMRPEAGLLVVFVSDEDEQSNTEFPTYSDFNSWYQTQRMGSVFMASIINLPSDESMCDLPPPAHFVGNRFIDATNSLGGVIVDICDPDWSPGVTDATHSIEPYESLKLTQQAEPDSVRVFVNGILNHDWYYDATDNIVHFTVTPSAGDLVEIGYLYKPDEGDTGDTG